MQRIKTWFRNLKVSQKLMLITVFFVMPDSLMFYFFITGMNANIRFAELEMKGNQYQRPLEELLKLIPEHRMLAEQAARDVARDAIPAGDLPDMQRRIGAAFDALEAVDARIGADLQFTDEGLAKRKREHFRARTLRADWQTLCHDLPGLDPAACGERHLRLVAAIRTMIIHSGDNSNLILDPDLDSYYVMDATLLALPATQDRLAAVMAHAEADLQQPTISPQERQQLAIHAALLEESDLDRIKGSLQTALNEDQNFYGVSPTLQVRLPLALEEYVVSAKAMIALTRQLASEETVRVAADEYRAVGQRARAASFRLWTVAAEELDALLRTRIETYQFRRAKSLVVAFLALCAAIGFVTFITRSISGPLRKQAEELRAANETLEAEIAERNRAEVQLEKAHRELVDSSRKAGMAEVATGVLHNVGNVLNSVNVAASLALEKLNNSKVDGLTKATVLLAQHEQDLGDFVTRDPQGQRLPRYLQRLSGYLVAENAAVRAELEQLGRNIEHIKEIVAMQQSYARANGALEDLPAERLLEDALQLNTASFERHGIVIERSFQVVPRVRVDKHKALQILINLLRNAKHAVEDSHCPDPRIGIAVEQAEDRVRIVVSDNGIGIPAQNLTSIFRHGFTTKKNGHGFGLHSGAIAAKEMGGSLTAASDGAGFGATFTLELPIAG
jgi:C4-dicarboxylate-specific signal transduction histidine kinase